MSLVTSRKGVRGAARHATDLFAFKRFVDEALEQSLRRHTGLKATLDDLLPAAARYLGAEAAVIRTRSEELREETFTWGKDPHTAGDRSWVRAPLDLAGLKVGMAAFAFKKGADEKNLQDLVEVFCEELDAILWNIQTASFKQDLIERVTQALTRPIFTDAIDDAVSVLREAIPFERLVILHVDESSLEERSLHYRLFKSSQRSRQVRCSHHSSGRPHRALDEAVASDGVSLLSPDRHRVARLLDLPYAVESLFIVGITKSEYLGQLIVSTPCGLDSLGRDLLKVFTSAVSQRLIDYQRERRHLTQYFNSATIESLMRQVDYHNRFLQPRSEKIAILYADINSFTRLCETLGSPDKIGSFIDGWSNDVVRILWKHGGVFDKMVGDCVIALFGPPFFRQRGGALAAAAVDAAIELQHHTRRLGESPDNARLAKKSGLAGLGVGVGIHLCEAAVGLFGPNRDYTAFGSGMNQTARLQSLAGFREILIMEPAKRVLPSRNGLRFEKARVVNVKNVALPLRFFKLANLPKNRP